jgi:hypothetical protein
MRRSLNLRIAVDIITGLRVKKKIPKTVGKILAAGVYLRMPFHSARK